MAGYSLWGLYDQSHDQSDSGCMHHTYIQNLGKQYWWTYLQRRNGDADVGNGLVDTAGEGEARTNWEGSIDVYTLTHSQSHSDVSDSLRPHGLQPARLLCPWDFPGKNTGVGCHSHLQEIFPIQGSNLSLLHCRQILHHLNHQGSPMYARNMWEAAIEHREPILELCDDLERWNAGRGRLKRVRGYIHIYHYGWLILMYGREHHTIVRQLSSNLKIHRERDRQVEGAGESSLCGASLWKKRDPVHWRQQSWLKQFQIQWKPKVGLSPD